MYFVQLRIAKVKTSLLGPIDSTCVREDIDKDSITYSSLKKVNQPVVNFYPEYKELDLGNDANNSNVRASYGSDKKINELINYAKQRYNANLSFYATYGTTNTLPDGNVLENGTIPQKAVELGKGKLGCRYWWGQATNLFRLFWICILVLQYSRI